MSKLSFRARALDAAKPMPIYMTEELPDLPDYSAINRAVPQMPSGMEKEEECEHHLQRAICTGLIIPTPEVSNIEDTEAYDRLYTTLYKMPRQLIHMQPFAMEQDIPDYDMDSEDERFVNAQAKKMDLTPLKFEEMMDRLEKGSGQTVVTLQEAKGLLKEDDDLIIAVYDYWLNKRLKTVVPLIPVVKTEHRIGSAANNPYLAFRRRTEKMQTRKNRKNDETSYEKMLKLRRDLSRTVTLLELVKRREKTKRELLHLTIEVFEKRYQAQDFSGQLLAEVSAIKTRPAFAPIFSNQFGLNQQHWLSKVPIKEEILVPRKEKRQYKRRKHKENIGSVINRGSYLMSSLQASQDAIVSSEEELEAPRPEFSDLSQCDSDGMFSFRRKMGCSYLPPTSGFGNWPWCGEGVNEADKRFRFYPTSIATPRNRHIGLARKRMGRGGRVILDRTSGFSDEFWSSVDFNVYDNRPDLPMYQPKSPPETNETQWTNSYGESAIESLPNTLIIDVENLEGCESVTPFHASDDEQIGDSKTVEKHSTGGKRGSADETLVLARKCEDLTSEPEGDSMLVMSVCNSKSDFDLTGSERTRRSDTFEDEVARFNAVNDGKGCVVSGRLLGSRNCEVRNRVRGERSHFHERKEAENFSFLSLSNLNRSGKNIFRRNYRIGGFRNISNWRKPKQQSCNGKNKVAEGRRDVFTTNEISLTELFAESSVNLIPEPELETNDDSFAILDKLGLDDDFIKKEPEISLDVDEKGGALIKTEAGQSNGSFQKQRLKIDKNIFEFSETDFLKYETDCDVDDLLPDLLQNDVVGYCGLFGLTPNSRFNLVSPTYLPLETDKADGDQLEEVIDGSEERLETGQPEKKSTSPNPSNFGQIADISSDIGNHEVTLQLKMNGNLESSAPENVLTSRLNVKNDFPDGYQLGNGEQAKAQRPQPQEQTINYIFALNHHNYTISGPPGGNVKQSPVENSQGSETQNQGDGGLQGATGNPVVSASSGTSQPSVQGNSWKPTLYRAGPGILRTYKGTNARNIQLTTDGHLVVQDVGKKTVSNGPTSIGFNQRRMMRATVSGQQQPASISAQNPTVTQLVTNPSVFTLEGISPSQNFVAGNQNLVVNQGFVTSGQTATNFLGSNQNVHYVATNQNVVTGNQIKQANLPQRKVSLLMNPDTGSSDAETVSVDLVNDSLETIDIERSEGDEAEGRASGQEITVENTNQMNVRKNNSLPMEVT
ncbi:hypothetical protein RUM44_006345 [Polyplax serrata]|uniref:Enhancer of polycomb-like protein n=1 Tax=Polyplax serrata TaxID=468196 RepID=A0ABR1AIJ6_POLSC